LAELERERIAGLSRKDRVARAARRQEELQQKKLAAEQRRKAWEEKAIKIVDGGRWDFKFRNISVDAAGPDGRGQKGTGWRYGVPLMDRKRAQVKIPTRVA